MTATCKDCSQLINNEPETDYKLHEVGSCRLVVENPAGASKNVCNCRQM